MRFTGRAFNGVLLAVDQVLLETALKDCIVIQTVSL